MSDEIEQSKLNVQKQLDEVITWMTTSAYRSYVATAKADLSGVEQSILETPPVDDVSRSHTLQLFGQRTALSSAITFFEDAQASLRNRLIAIGDEESQEPENN